MLELCEVINQCGEPLFTPEEKVNDPRIVISFGELFGVSFLKFSIKMFHQTYKIRGKQ